MTAMDWLGLIADDEGDHFAPAGWIARRRARRDSTQARSCRRWLHVGDPGRAPQRA